MTAVRLSQPIGCMDLVSMSQWYHVNSYIEIFTTHLFQQKIAVAIALCE